MPWMVATNREMLSTELSKAPRASRTRTLAPPASRMPTATARTASPFADVSRATSSDSRDRPATRLEASREAWVTEVTRDFVPSAPWTTLSTVRTMSWAAPRASRRDATTSPLMCSMASPRSWNSSCNPCI
ncbi:MAG: hypothetical protein BWY88_00572 [Synergistetes bacterium ADurb.Bin520]|nr:MAG: hypothetical protein BWY88_00572 [Synergistetes bacterium ADurb.Bin520]